MRYLLDTNVISELRKSASRADTNVRAWVAARPPDELNLSVVTIHEVELGIGRVARRDGRATARLQEWLENDLLDVFKGRILPMSRLLAVRHDSTCPTHDQNVTR